MISQMGSGKPVASPVVFRKKRPKKHAFFVFIFLLDFLPPI